MTHMHAVYKYRVGTSGSWAEVHITAFPHVLEKLKILENQEMSWKLIKMRKVLKMSWNLII